MWSTSLSTDTSGIYFRHRSACRTPAESRREYLTRGKEHREPRKTPQDEGTGGKTGVLVGLDLPSAGHQNPKSLSVCMCTHECVCVCVYAVCVCVCVCL